MSPLEPRDATPIRESIRPGPGTAESKSPPVTGTSMTGTLSRGNSGNSPRTPPPRGGLRDASRSWCGTRGRAYRARVSSRRPESSRRAHEEGAAHARRRFGAASSSVAGQTAGAQRQRAGMGTAVGPGCSSPARDILRVRLVRPELRALAKIEKGTFSPGNSDDRLGITDHTASIGSKAYREVLSLRRAGEVKRVLVGCGVQETPDHSLARGVAQPPPSNDAAVSRRRTRRGELQIVLELTSGLRPPRDDHSFPSSPLRSLAMFARWRKTTSRAMASPAHGTGLRVPHATNAPAQHTAVPPSEPREEMRVAP